MFDAAQGRGDAGTLSCREVLLAGALFGACLALVAAVALTLFGRASLLVHMPDATQQVVAELERSAGARQHLGTPIRGLWEQGQVSWREGGVADFHVNVEGSRRSGVVHARGTVLDGGIRFSEITLRTGGRAVRLQGPLVSGLE